MAWWNLLFGGNVNRTSGPRPVNVGNFQPAPTGFQWGRSMGGSGMRPMTGIGGAQALLTGQFNPRTPGVVSYTNPDEEEFARRTYGDEQENRGGDRIRRLLTGGSGQAIAGGAAAVANVIGAALEQRTQQQRNKLEREQFELMKKQEEERRKRDEEIRKLLMTEYDKFRPRG